MWTNKLLERIRCFCQGHCAVSSYAIYSAKMDDGRVRELRYCFACDSLVKTDLLTGEANSGPRLDPIAAIARCVRWLEGSRWLRE